VRNRRRSEWNALFSVLPSAVQRLTRTVFSRFCENPRHPSLRFKKMRHKHQGRDCYEVSITRDYRAVAYSDGDTYVWFWVGKHGDFDNRF
jgi:hypothetical protein